MVREDLIAGLKNALERSQSPESAVQSFISAGYNPEEVQEAYRYVNTGKPMQLQNAPKPAYGQNQIQSMQQMPNSNSQTQAQQHQQAQQLQAQRQQQQNQQTQVKKSSGNKIIIIFIVLLVIIVLGLAGFLLYPDKILDLFKK